MTKTETVILSSALGLLLVLIGVLTYVKPISNSAASGAGETESTRALASPMLAAKVSPPSSTRVVGVSERTDAVGDVRDGEYRKARRSWPGTDLVSVRLEANAHSLIATFTAVVEFPVSVSGIETRGYWSLDLCSPDGENAISLRSKIWDTGWSTDSIDFGGGVASYPGDVRVQGKRMILTFSRDALPSWLNHPFKWRAGSEWNGTWKDEVPNENKDGDAAWVTLSGRER